MSQTFDVTISQTLSKGTWVETNDYITEYDMLDEEGPRPYYNTEDTDWYNAQYDGDGNLIQEAIDRTQSTITLGYRISGSDLFICELQNGSSVFPYTFPVIF